MKSSPKQRPSNANRPDSARVEYDTEQRPVLEFEGERYTVLELTNSRVRIVMGEKAQQLPVDGFLGTLHFASGAAVPVEMVVTGMVELITTLKTTSRLPTSVINRRAHFRVQYGVDDPVFFSHLNRRHKVHDVSETGLCIRGETVVGLEEGQEIHGVVFLQSGDRVRVQGDVDRVKEQECSLRLVVGVPLDKIIQEQRIILRKNRDRKEE